MDAVFPRNFLLRRLQQWAPDRYARIAPLLTPIELDTGAIIARPGEQPALCYVVETGAVSIVAQTEEGESMEVGFVGPEGLAPAPALLASHQTRFLYQVQLPLTGWTIPVRTLVRCRSMNDLLLVYSEYLGVQLGRAALCGRYHSAVQRLARWLVLSSLRDGRFMGLTHEFLATMIGAPRSAVSEAAAELRARGAIDYERGRVRIVDRVRLREAACECATALTAALAEFEETIAEWAPPRFTADDRSDRG